jgi:hypothetical protein
MILLHFCVFVASWMGNVCFYTCLSLIFACCEVAEYGKCMKGCYISLCVVYNAYIEVHEH